MTARILIASFGCTTLFSLACSTSDPTGQVAPLGGDAAAGSGPSAAHAGASSNDGNAALFGACAATLTYVVGGSGLPFTGPACATVTDCAGTTTSPQLAYCFGGSCSPDQCLLDTDCPTGQSCACGAWFFGVFVPHYNHCVASGCRVNADCPSGRCDLSFDDRCGSFLGKACRSASDTCASDSDCAPAGACIFAQELGHWVCGSPPLCGG